MSKWDKYSNPKPGNRQSYDPDTCPSGCDREVWSLALLFEQLANKNGYQLPQGRFLIHDYLLKRIAESGIRGKPATFWKDDSGTVQSWSWCVEAAIKRYWDWNESDVAGEHALDDFCGMLRFKEMMNGHLTWCANRRSIARAQARG